MKKAILLPFIMLLFITATQLSAQTVQAYEDRSDSFYNVEKYDSAFKYAQMAEPLIIDSFGKNSLEYAWFIGQFYTMINERLNNIDIAATMYKQSLVLFEQLNDTTSYKYGETLTNYGTLLNTNVSFTAALPYLQKAVNVMQNHKDDVDAYAGSMNNLANGYNFSGEYSKAETLYKECLQLIEQNIKLNPRKSLVVHNLGTLYFKRGNLIAAKENYISARKAVHNNMEGKLLYIEFSKELGDLYLKIGNVDSAAILYNLLYNDTVWTTVNTGNYKNIFKVRYAQVINGMGNVKEARQEYIEAEKLYKESISTSIASQLIMPTFYKYAGAVSLANLYFKNNRFKEADSLYNILITNFKETINEDRYNYLGVYVKYCENLLKMGQLKLAAEKTKYITKIILENFHNNFPGMTEDDQMRYVRSTDQFINLTLSAFSNSFSFDKEFVKLALSELLQLKGIIRVYQAGRLQSLRISTDTVLTALNNKWLFIKQLLYNKYCGVYKSALNTDSLQKVAADLEEKISLITGKITDNINDEFVDKISNRLALNEAALEYVHYRKIQEKIDVYGVFIMRQNKEPVYVELCTEKQLQQCLKEKKANKFLTVQSQVINSQAIYNLIWKPVEDFLKNKDIIFYSPDGLLNYFSFDGIRTKNNAYLIDQKKMVLLFNTRNILNRPINSNEADAAVLWGQIDCSEKAYLAGNDLITTSKKTTVGSGLPDGLKGNGKKHFSEWKDEELPAIIDMANQKKLRVEVYAKKNATEENFKQNSASFKGILHISSHGFYSNLSTNTIVKEGALNPFNSLVNPLLRCGLVLNGGNYVWSGNEPLPDKEDGILTGYEIALMDLSKVDLVVLSACETGLGDLDTGSEGVLGLQRAFTLAGVKKMVVTLWEVGVRDTKIFMTYFYKELFNGKNPETALHNAKKIMAKNSPPLAWAGFELVE